METTVIYIRANRGEWSLTCEGETWIQKHIGLFGAALARRRLGLPNGAPVEFRLL